MWPEEEGPQRCVSSSGGSIRAAHGTMFKAGLRSILACPQFEPTRSQAHARLGWCTLQGGGRGQARVITTLASLVSWQAGRAMQAPSRCWVLTQGVSRNLS
jgi:hypothetical protein